MVMHQMVMYKFIEISSTDYKYYNLGCYLSGLTRIKSRLIKNLISEKRDVIRFFERQWA